MSATARPSTAADTATETAPEPLAAFSRERAVSLVIQTSFLGDMVLTTPLIAELALRGPVDVVATPASAPLLANNPSIRDVIVYDKRGDAAGLGGLWRTSRALRRRRVTPGEPVRQERRAVQTAYLAQGSIRSAMLAVLAGIRERVGFSTSAGWAFYTRRVLYRNDRHHAERLWRLGATGDEEQPSSAQLRPRLFPGDAEVSAVESLLRSEGHDEGTAPFVALAPGSIWATKRWPYYAELARALAPRVRLAVVGGAADRELAAAIAAAVAPHRVIDAVGRLSLLASAELIGRAASLVTNDSAPQHLASAMGTPTVTIFGPTVPEFGFGPLASGSASQGHQGLDCRPCHPHGPERCPLAHWRCMRELVAETVLTSVLAHTSIPGS